MAFVVSKYVALAGCLLAFAPREAKAWSRDGHRIVCRIAWQLLDQSHRDEIDRLTRTYRNPDGQPVGPFWDACAFADDARAKARGAIPWSRFAVFETWHYANVPRTTTRFPASPCQTPCVITAVLAHTDSLRNASGDPSRSEALFFLSHWMGDLHQPLHVSFADDRGGNEVRVESGYYSAPNMHTLWDGGILAHLPGADSWQTFADQMARDVTPAHHDTWIQGTAGDWAQESYDLITAPSAQYCEWQVIRGATTCAARPGSRTLGEQYQLEFADDVILRLRQAGVRLAGLLRLNLATR